MPSATNLRAAPGCPPSAPPKEDGLSGPGGVRPSPPVAPRPPSSLAGPKGPSRGQGPANLQGMGASPPWNPSHRMLAPLS